jgi:hypothetical protein
MFEKVYITNKNLLGCLHKLKYMVFNGKRPNNIDFLKVSRAAFHDIDLNP